MKRVLFALGIIALSFLADQGGRSILVCRLGVCAPPPSTIQDPGPSQALFNSPYYSCTTNRYVSTTGSDSNNGTASDNAHAWLTIKHADSATPSAGWCINVLPGTYSLGATITNGGSSAASTGYVVYRCTTLDGCNINGDQGETFGSTFGIADNVNYVMIDGFNINGGNNTSTNTNGIGSGSTNASCCFAGSNSFRGPHHLWVLNSIITGFGQSGIQLNQGDYLYAVHNTIFDNSHDCDIGVQGSNISYYLPIAVPSYSPTSDDQNNPVTGNTGTLFHNFAMWNVLYLSYICTNNNGVTDGNGIIFDDWFGDQFTTCVNGNGNTSAKGGCAYLGGGLAAFNVVYNNGSYGIHPFAGQYATFANNSVFNNNLQAGNNATQTVRYGIGDNGTYGLTAINNISYTGCSQSNNTAITLENTQNTIGVTTLNGTITAGATSLTPTSSAQFPNGTTWNTELAYLASPLPGGNLIQIDSEILWVTAGWGTSTWTVTRGFNGTTAASHNSGATIQWIQNYWSHNITHTTGACSEVLLGGPNTAGSFYSSTDNQEATLPGWVNVGNSSFGTQTTVPVGTNFALLGGSASIGYSLTASPFNFLPAQAVDAGACASSLTTCP